MTLAVRASLALALALAVTPALADPANFPVRASNGSTPTLAVFALPDGSVATKHVQVDPVTGSTYGLLDGFSVAPAISVGVPVHRGALVITAGTAVQAMPRNAARRAGYCQASLSNTGVVSISTTGAPVLAPNLSNDAELSPGQPFDLNHNGVIDQGPVIVTSTAPNDLVVCQELN